MATVTGLIRALNNGAPSGATLRWRQLDPPAIAGGALVSSRPIVTTPDEDGEFSQELVAGNHQVTIEHAGKPYGTWKVPVPVGDGSHDVTSLIGAAEIDPEVFVTYSQAEVDALLAALPTGGACSGSPEGVVTAAVGSLRWDASAMTLWLKNTGAGNTGWIVAFILPS